MENKKIILVTGGSGLVGSAIKKIYDKYNQYDFIFISSKDGNLADMRDTIQIFEKIKPNYVIHLAACVGGLYKNMNNKVEMFEKNVMINYNVVKCSHDFKVEKFIGCLSTCIFPDKVVYPIDETMLHNGPPHSSNDAYAYAKRMLEIHCKSYRENFGDNFICVTPTNIYGPHDNFDLENGHVLPVLLHKCYLAKKNNTKFIVRGTGAPLRQFIYSEDLAKLILWALEKSTEDNIILSVPENYEISIGNVAKIIAKYFDYGNHLVFDETFSDGQYKKTVSAEKILSLYNFEFINIEEGIKNTIEWFVSQQETKL